MSRGSNTGERAAGGWSLEEQARREREASTQTATGQGGNTEQQRVTRYFEYAPMGTVALHEQVQLAPHMSVEVIA